MQLTGDYPERVYAGVLGKIIGVYLGRPFEGWKHERILAELGEVTYYVNEALGKPLIVTDDDISGTFTFLRALPDHGNRSSISSAEIGKTWLNYIIEQRTTLWWGGMGNSTEHTAFLRLKEGRSAPDSGSIELNGRTVAEQIGSEIFIDGWAMVAPGDPELAASLAKRAAEVSHAGEAVYAAQLLAAMEALAFIERDLNKLLDGAQRHIPKDSTIYRVVEDLRAWHASEKDWRSTRQRVAEVYGYDKFPGHVHVVPNHAVVLLALLYGDDDFQRSLMIANTSGWDTDCNSGNVGCLLGIKNGLSCFSEGPDWRGPVADRIYLSSGDVGRGITDAVQEALEIVDIGRALSGDKKLERPKRGARFHFEFPGAVQGFALGGAVAASASLANVAGHSEEGERSLAIRYRELGSGRTLFATTPTFIPPEAIQMAPYGFMATPTIYPGQRLSLRAESDESNSRGVTVAVLYRCYDGTDGLTTRFGPSRLLAPGESATIEWVIEETDSQPIAEVGIELSTKEPAEGVVYLDYLTWKGPPNVTFARPESGGTTWRRAWVDAVDHFTSRWIDPFGVSQDRGIGLLSIGTHDWSDYRATAEVSSDLSAEFGIAARVGGQLRYYALVLSNDGNARLVKCRDERTTLASCPFAWELGRKYTFMLEVAGNRILGSIDGKGLFDVRDEGEALENGGVALLCSAGQLSATSVRVEPTLVRRTE